jgi:hypothetical protein
MTPREEKIQDHRILGTPEFSCRAQVLHRRPGSVLVRHTVSCLQPYRSGDGGLAVAAGRPAYEAAEPAGHRVRLLKAQPIKDKEIDPW